MMEEGLASQIADFSANFSHKELEEVARSGRLVIKSTLFKSFSLALTVFGQPIARQQFEILVAMAMTFHTVCILILV